MDNNKGRIHVVIERAENKTKNRTMNRGKERDEELQNDEKNFFLRRVNTKMEEE